eukprot:m.64442 g.64442  ORF g.64442 m.64442 type:complete len:222 (-) comp19547_c0_seq2:604-1269(-)
MEALETETKEIQSNSSCESESDCSSDDETLVFEPFDWYEHPLYYDMVFESDTPDEASFLVDVLKKYGPGASTPPPGSLSSSPNPLNDRRSLRFLEPACGSGRLVLEFARRGFETLGYDISKGSLTFAAARAEREDLASRARFMEGDMKSFVPPNPGHYHLAYNLVSSFKFLLTDEDVWSHFKCVSEALCDGGLYVLGIHLTDYEFHGEHGDREKWRVSREV